MNDIIKIKCEYCPRVCPEAYQKMVEKYSRACQERDRANEMLRERCIRYAEEAMELKARLKAYEDTGLEPEDIKAAVTPDALVKVVSQMLNVQPDHLRELVTAEKEGRLVWLPCKVGDTVYWLHNGVVTECRVHRIQMNRTGLFICLKSKLSHGAFRVDSCLGKTVFLTREEAEAALKEGEG